MVFHQGVCWAGARFLLWLIRHTCPYLRSVIDMTTREGIPPRSSSIPLARHQTAAPTAVAGRRNRLEAQAPRLCGSIEQP
jgi:hypothetical protein